MFNKRLVRVLQAVVLVVVVLGLYGCGSSKESQAYDNATGMADQAVKTETVQEEAKVQEADTGDMANPESPKVNTDVGYNRKIIKRGELQLQTKDFKKSVEGVIAKVQSLNGYVENSNIQGNNLYNGYSSRRNASITVRIPQKHFDSFINQSSEFGNIVNTTSDSEDITSAYVDTEIRLKALKSRHQRLLELLKQSGSLKDLFAIEQELGDVTYEIEKLSGSLQAYDQLVDMSTIHIQIEEVYKIEEIKPVITFGDKVADTFRESVKGLKRLLGGIVLIGVGITPFLVIIVPIVIVVFLFARKGRKNKTARIQKSDDEK